MKFGSPEYFWLSLFGLTIIAGINSDSMILGLMSGAFGLVLSTIGMDPMEGVERFMFGQDALYNGVNITGALIGLFSLSQAFILAEKAIVKRARAAHFDDSIILTKSELKQITPTVLRSWIIGNIIGILPRRASIACFMGYNEAKRFQSIQKSLVMAPLKGLPVLRRPIMLLRAVPSSLPSLWASLARALQLSSWAGSSFKGFSPDLSSLQSMQT